MLEEPLIPEYLENDFEPTMFDHVVIAAALLLCAF